MDLPRDKNSIKPTAFELLLFDIRTKLGPSWSFFEECLEAVFRAAKRGQDTSAWLEQMEQLLQSREDLAFSCQGILFLLAEKGIKKQTRPARSTKMAPPMASSMAPPPLPRRIMELKSTPKKAPRLHTPDIQPVKHLQQHAPSQPSVNFSQQRPPLQTSFDFDPPHVSSQDYFLSQRTPTQSSFSHPQQSTPTEPSFQLFPQPTPTQPSFNHIPQPTYNQPPQYMSTGPVPPSSGMPSSASGPQIHEEPRQRRARQYGHIVYFDDLNKPAALREEVNPRTVFFDDPTFKPAVEDFFHEHDHDDGKYDALRAPYDADTDDLVVWKEHDEDDLGV